MDQVARRVEEASPEMKTPPSTHETMNLIVLMVENDEDVLFASTSKLESWGASVLAASSTQEARMMIRDIGIPPDIILADYQLDDDDNGIDTIKAIRADTGVQVPAIMITADRAPWLVEAGVAEDFTVLTKPVQLSRLRPLIDWKTRWQAEALAIGARDKSIA
jgi:CheY-like chemotaxis protein